MTAQAVHFPGKTVFLTGASGVVGQALLPRLAGTRLTCLVRSRPVSGDNITSLQGDVLQPRLGLSEDEYRGAAKGVDLIIHAAAITDFLKPEQEIFDTNVEGTRRIVQLALDLGVPLYYVSTAFVRPTSRSTNEPNPYEVSKNRAEEIIRQSGVHWTILRPSIVVGDSATGQISQFQGLHFMAGLVLNGMLPVVPADGNSFVDFVPQDFVADAIIAAAESGETEREYWLTAGARALTINQLLDVCTEHAKDLVGRTLLRPKLVQQEVFDRLIKPVFMPALPGTLQRTLERALQMARYMNIYEPFESSFGEMRAAWQMPPFPDSPVTFLHNLEYWARISPYAKGNKASS